MSKFHPLLTPLEPLDGGSSSERYIRDLPGGSTAWFATALASAARAPVVLVASNPARAEALGREALFFSRGQPQPPPLLSFPAWETLPFESISPFGPIVGERLATLSRLIQVSGSGPILAGPEEAPRRALVITTPAALMQRTIPNEVLAENGFSVSVGDQLDLPAFREFLAKAGYRNVTQVSEPGEFSARGGIVDFFPSGHPQPVRVELFGDEVESMRLFDPMTQRSSDPIPQVRALPVCEVVLTPASIGRFRTRYRAAFGGGASADENYRLLSDGTPFIGMEQYLPFFYEQPHTLFNYLPNETTFLLEADVEEATETRIAEIMERHKQLTSSASQEMASGAARVLPDPRWLYPTLEEYRRQLASRRIVRLSPPDNGRGISLGCQSLPTFSQALKQNDPKTVMQNVAEFLKEIRNKGGRVVFTARTVGQRERLREMLEEQRIDCADLENWNPLPGSGDKPALLALGDISAGFHHPASKLALISEETIFGHRVRRRADRKYIDQLIASFADLSPNDPVVHSDHGIGRYVGLESLKVGEIQNDFMLIRYTGDDKLYVPMQNLDRVGKYMGGEEAPLDKLGGIRWEKTKKKAQKDLMAMAAELVRLQAERNVHTGFAFSKPDALYQEFAASFPYEETPDQSQAIEAVLDDMAGTRPMDRLVCGDVGFGKTEVALRAAFRAVMDGKQVALLVPTTILAQQHYQTFANRFAPYPVNIHQLSRFRPLKERKISIAGLASGRVDIIIGTHRLLQKDIEFKDLGLLIVDEEQRFGVAHKEKIKRFRATVDLLTLTATPIPRTMHMAMSGVRDISIIASPPPDRLSIQTVVVPFDPQRIREAILRELYRGGQVFYLYNHVEDIDKQAAKLAELVPEAKVGVAHGQMRETRLEKIMHAFYQQEFNVLVCTTIIENGVDIPSANTIIIHGANRFGLAQLHQLRGRVGRSRHRGYAYMLIPHQDRLSKDAKKRLEAIESLGDLGSGFMLATHDLEIRGAGNILGDAQSGQIRDVGYELFNQMLTEAIQSIKAGGDGVISAEDKSAKKSDEIVPEINLNLSTYIPEDYIPDVKMRLSIYKRISQLT
ncbi:MAG: transcription-repair coupling factor, partial [Magnetococcales bacterium]|nr:transcription-repair coupling factor [Magnetococcales bacterium]